MSSSVVGDVVGISYGKEADLGIAQRISITGEIHDLGNTVN